MTFMKKRHKSHRTSSSYIGYQILYLAVWHVHINAAPQSSEAAELRCQSRQWQAKVRPHIRRVLTRELNWLDAHGLVEYHRLCLVHSAITTGRPESIVESIGAVAQHQYQTRGASQRVLSRIRTELGRRRLCYSGVQPYN